MPIREYGCNACENVFEVLVQSVEDIPLRCPDCKSERLTAFISWRGVITGEHRKALDRHPPDNKIQVNVPANITPITKKTRKKND